MQMLVKKVGVYRQSSAAFFFYCFNDMSSFLQQHFHIVSDGNKRFHVAMP